MVLLCRYCEHNPDLAKASCDVAQELTNEQIDALNEDEEEFDVGCLLSMQFKYV